jgi:NDP-hexose 2,3-enoyl reductase
MAECDVPVTALGRTGLRISRLVLGTVNFGGRVDEPEARRLMDHAVACGVTAIDTADIYGWRVHQGYTEEVIGRWLRCRPGRREEVVLATKVGNRFGGGPHDEGLSARHVLAACDASLRRLRTDWIDLYQMHRVDPTVAWDEVWQAMDCLVTQGKVRYVGSSNFAGWQLAAAQECAGRRQLLGLASEQCVYNLVTRHCELEVLPAAAVYGIGVLVWSPLHGGLLSGVLSRLRDGTAVKSAQGRAAACLDRHRQTLAEYERFCAEIGRPTAEVGLAWVLSRQHITAPVIGPRTEQQLDGAVRALNTPLSEGQLARLDALFPPVGLGVPAPGAWTTQRLGLAGTREPL